MEIYCDADLSEDCNMALGKWLYKRINEFMILTLRLSTLYDIWKILFFSTKSKKKVLEFWRLKINSTVD